MTTEVNTTEYLAQLLKDKKQLAAFPNVILHLERILDEGTKQRLFSFPKDSSFTLFTIYMF